jgi:hypothetical protein
LDGEMTVKFILKAVTAIFIAAAVFSYYFFDIRRDKVEEKDRIIKIYFFASLILVIASLTAAFVYSPTPAETRAKRQDNETLNRFNMIDNAINSYYAEKKKMPENLKELIGGNKYLIDSRYIKDAVSGEEFSYKILSDKKSYELCAKFQSSNRTNDNMMDDYMRDRWPHDAGYKCINQGIYSLDDVKGGILPIPRPID